MSKASLKSTNKARTEPLLSWVCIHLCWIAISACVVDLPGRQPNWFSSRNGSNEWWHKPISDYAFEYLGKGREKRDWTEIILDRSGWVDLRNRNYLGRLPNPGNNSFSNRVPSLAIPSLSAAPPPVLSPPPPPRVWLKSPPTIISSLYQLNKQLKQSGEFLSI